MLIIDNGGRDQNLHFLHAVVNDHRNASFDNVKIMRSGSRNNTFKRKVSEALLNSKLKPTLIVQEKSVE